MDGAVARYLEERSPQDVMRCYARERSQLDAAIEQRDYMVQRLSFAGLTPEDKTTTVQHFISAHNAIARLENEIEMCAPPLPPPEPPPLWPLPRLECRRDVYMPRRFSLSCAVSLWGSISVQRSRWQHQLRPRCVLCELNTQLARRCICQACTGSEWGFRSHTHVFVFSLCISVVIHPKFRSFSSVRALLRWDGGARGSPGTSTPLQQYVSTLPCLNIRPRPAQRHQPATLGVECSPMSHHPSGEALARSRQGWHRLPWLTDTVCHRVPPVAIQPASLRLSRRSRKLPGCMR